jgi:hypothetical protein
MDFKYKTDDPNIFCCPNVSASSFGKGMLWVMQAAHMGIKWAVGDGRKVRF